MGEGVRCAAWWSTSGPRVWLSRSHTTSRRLPEPLRFVAVQALAKGERSELAVEMMTEMGVTEIVPWQASRSIVRWSEERGVRSLTRWRSTVREAAKQSRRLNVPQVWEPVTTRLLTERGSDRRPYSDAP
jgi:16S rRNA (uracil1498-N3)-methyltransferase